jgi:hypothetical protein
MYILFATIMSHACEISKFEWYFSCDFPVLIINVSLFTITTKLKTANLINS